MKRPTGPQLIALKNAIMGCFTEARWRELALLTDTHSIVDGHRRLLRSLSWGDDDYEDHVLSVLKDIIDADAKNLAIVMDYVARHCPEAGEFVSSHDEQGRRILFSPVVFKVPAVSPNPKLISVMMPFKLEMQDVYETIKAAANDAGFECKRADDIWDDPTIIQDVFALIFESYIVVCDFSGREPNVFYEAGIAHTLGKHVVPITQSLSDIPFDLRHHRHACYLNNAEGRSKLGSNLADRFATLGRKTPGTVQ